MPRARQTTLAKFEFEEDIDPEYGHLVEHLIDVDDTTKKNDMWTGVFTRDDDPLKAVPLYFIGEALKYDRSLRDLLPDYSN